MATLVVYSSDADGQVSSTNGTYSTCRSGSGLVANTTAWESVVGQIGFYTCYELFWDWDTSSLGSSAEVSSAIANTNLTSDGSTTDFEARIGLYDWGTSVTTADWRNGAALQGLTQLAHLNSSAMGSSGTNTDWIDDAFAANVNKTGETRVCVFSAEQENDSAPVTDEYVGLSMGSNPGTSDDPKLTVTYTVGGLLPVSSATLQAVSRAAVR